MMVLFVAAVLSTGTSVSAHTAFAGSTPADGGVVAEPVALMTLVFTGVSEQAGDGFVVVDATGDVREPTMVSTLDNMTFTLTFDPPLSGGQFGVRWSVRAPDAHPIEGAFSFTVTASSTDAALATAEPSTTIGAADMSQMSPEEMAAMEEFLSVDASRPGESRATVGRLISFGAIALALGGIAFAATTLRGEAREIGSLVIAVRSAGGLIAIGALIEYTGVSQIADASLVGYWTSSPGFATVLRMFAGLAIAIGLVETTVVVRSSKTSRPLSSAPNVADGHGQVGGFWGPQDGHVRQQPAGSRDSRTTPVRRWCADRSSALAFVGCGAAVISFWFDGHTVSKGFRPLHAIANSVHVVAGSVWVGGVVALAAVAWTRHRRGVPSRALGLVVRFSAVASVALGAVIVAGLVMAVSVLDSFGGLTGTEWGQVLLLKSAAASLAMLGGAYNHFRLLPALEADPESPELLAELRSVVTSEAIMLVFVVTVTAWLVSAAS